MGNQTPDEQKKHMQRTIKQQRAELKLLRRSINDIRGHLSTDYVLIRTLREARMPMQHLLDNLLREARFGNTLRVLALLEEYHAER